MRNRGEIAEEYLSSGYNCGQSLFLAFSDEHAIPAKTAARLSCCLGGGFSQTGGLCGAVSGACLALSARFGREEPSREGESRQRQQITYALVQSLQRTFFEEFGSIRCEELLQRGTQVSEGRNNKCLCPEYVRRAALICEELIRRETENPPFCY